MPNSRFSSAEVGGIFEAEIDRKSEMLYKKPSYEWPLKTGPVDTDIWSITPEHGYSDSHRATAPAGTQ
jgi:hypothetical protein